jgi:hypothetical protein
VDLRESPSDSPDLEDYDFHPSKQAELDRETSPIIDFGCERLDL